MSTEAACGGTWEHAACGASGEAQWADEDTASSKHDCAGEGAATWSAEWHCHDCGVSGDGQFDDDTTTYFDHECADDEDREAVA
ncbi:hypothetical protein [Streptomyces sp. NPDC005408]|uniref:hypothetical protein n=1 Tax=Streptomyces sp. NPDC005408 TaxID=3155341 RepID=UPI0033A182C2